MSNRQELALRVLAERERQTELPGLEYDVRNGPSDWVSIAAHYLFEEIGRGGGKPSRAAFEDSLIKAAAVILAALEHGDHMQKHDRLVG